MNESLKNFLRDHGRVLALAGAAALVMLTLFLLVKTVDALDRVGKSPYAGPNVITVTGTGKAESPPTIAQVVFTVQESAATVQAAQDAASARTAEALNALRELGIEDRDVQATGYNVYPQYESSRPCPPGALCPEISSPRIIGYQVSQTVTVKIRNTDMAGEVLQVLGDAGVQNISGPDFRVDDDTEVMAEARAEAIADARAKAKVLAKQLGVRLGDVVSYNEGGGPIPYYGGMGGGMDMALEKAAAVPLPQGQNESEVTVMVTFEIK